MKLYFRRYGEGPPLMILHGLYGSSDNWVTVAKTLGEIFTVYLPDLRNHGQSGHSEEHNYDAMRNDIHELAGSEGIRKFFLAGHSMGGKCAVAYSLMWPEMLYGLLVADISPFRNGRTLGEEYMLHQKILTAMVETDPGTKHSRKEVEEIIASRLENEKVAGFILKNLQREENNTFRWKLNAPSLLKNLDHITSEVDYSLTEAGHVTCFPVMFLRGEFSSYLPEEDFALIRKVYPAAEFTTITGAGHWLHSDNPSEVTDSFRKLKDMAG